MDFSTPIIKLNRVGATLARRFGRLGVKTAGDLLNWFPFRYEDYRRIIPIGKIVEGEAITVCGRLELIANRRSFRSRKIITTAMVSDESGSVRVVWFNQPYITKNLKPGDMIFLSGKVKADMLGPQFVSPMYERMNNAETTHTARMVPIYPLTDGITQKQIRFLMSQVMPLAQSADDWLPDEILERFDLAPLKDALQGIHLPKDEIDLKQCTDRLKFNELFVLQFKAELARREMSSTKAPAMEFKEDAIKKFVAGLPFKLTKGQKVAAWEILKDLQNNAPMNRLLSGDVGSGKTVIAAIAILNTVLNGYQAILMAPTEILARQHFESFKKLFGGKIQIGLQTRSQIFVGEEELTKKKMAQFISRGEVKIIIGTHALLSEKILFSDVGLIVVDEQHRFGVAQRKAIKDKTDDVSAHYLSMTATPIPRSLALMIYGDLDLSAINEMPAGRKPIITRLVEPKNREKAYEFICGQVKQGRQIFVICPLIEQAPTEDFIPINYDFTWAGQSDKKTVMNEFTKLSEEIFPDFLVGYLHGKLKPAEKEATMKKFQNNEINILVSTSVVEVGIDIPNASVMMIEGADRFGLAQLHQFRGRVGRSVYQSYCFLFTGSESEKVKDRLTFFEQNLNGFNLAEKDLETRGPGEVYGTAQSGLANLRLAKLTDKEVIVKTRSAAVFVAQNLKKFPKIRHFIAKWEKGVHLE
ncbi:MAG: ATP-dependent DNA helicase RecG [Candidatus Magasanikbacteria bacterium]|nr:ATP-dependent DNA helicase RecG [Candidatus Magasanikbacteria bacterium]